MLYPVLNQTRNLIDLTGMWNVELEKKEAIDPALPLKNTLLVAVPGSINDQFVDEEIREHAGNFWYETNFTLPQTIYDQRKVIRFSSVTHEATVYLNGVKVAHHIGGFTPFEVEIDSFVTEGPNNLKVCVSNILDESTLPCGIHTEKNGKQKVIPRFDFYNYSGIHRPVKLYTTNQTYIKDIVIDYHCKDNGRTEVAPMFEIEGSYEEIEIKILDESGQVVDSQKAIDSHLVIEDTKLWQPLNAYLYTLEVSLFKNGQLLDTYKEAFGVRTIKIENNKFLINDKEFYFKGFGKHEDFPVIGKGLNSAVTNLDKNLMKWIGANSFRTSHYPYSEEEMQLADREGFVVINEVPGVGLFTNFHADVNLNTNDKNTWETLKTHQNHKNVIKELVQRDKNHACVAVWAVANEPASHQQGAYDYFKPLVDLTKQLDHQKRPVVIPNIVNATPELDQAAELVDILCLNRYYGWYIDHGDLESAMIGLRNEIKKWHEKYPEKPIMFSEFGADTVSGLHSLYRTPYSEEYQIDFYKANFNVLDELDYVIGEHLWNFADFETAPNIRRIDGNKKGIFTRDRRPKSIAFEIKKRWEMI
ncbi:beta-glucuronidase [Enterococcus termitis]|uniref:Beta-glucuronidase n=1 Tax=Enterococcus termitis TaxID=332950 RepID=A0A1E5GAQ4_9ENTE|nr:beta-glucuronidase [Enterococcus termitis]OEG09779.1 beta-glucuronidase [Enterococcus termitis]